MPKLAEEGFKVALVEAGSPIEPFKAFKHTFPYELDFRGAGQPGLLRKYFKNSTEYNYRIMIDDRENPYTTPPDKPFNWLRSRVWAAEPCIGRAAQTACLISNSRQRHVMATGKIGRSRTRTSRRIMTASRNSLESVRRRKNFPQFPDGVFLPPMALNCAETIFKAACKKVDFPVTQRRVAQLTRMLNNRPPCHYCGNCVNGCDVGAMFSTVSTTLPPALKTGNVTVLCDSVVSRVLVDAEHRARGVRVYRALHK